MSMPESIKEFIKWLQGFDYHLWQNVDDIHPHLQSLLTKSDFQPSVTREANRLIVARPKVAIACNLPQALGQGDCHIEFSNIFFSGLKISINHQNLLGEFMLGLHTQPEWKCRPFLKQIDKNAFEASLGQTKIILSAIEAIDLCLCIDEVCQQYKNSIIEFENHLESWNLDFVEFADIRGFRLFSVEQELWNLMYKFACEFNYIKGKSEWHLFHQDDISIRVSRGIRDHAYIIPQIDSQLSLLSHNKVNILYKINDTYFPSVANNQTTSQIENIGIRGTWTAKYTKQWLLEKYIPKVIEYYSQESQLITEELLLEIIQYKFEQTPIKDINDIRDFLPYLRDIQSWLHIYIENIAAVLLRSYYRAFVDLLRNTDSAITGIDYIMRNLHGIEWSNTAKENTCKTRKSTTYNFKNAIDYLDKQVARINNCEYEKSLNADLITRIFIWIIENGKISFSQAHMNAAKQAVIPLWEQSHFEMRHVYPHR